MVSTIIWYHRVGLGRRFHMDILLISLLLFPKDFSYGLHLVSASSCDDPAIPFTTRRTLASISREYVMGDQ